MEHLSDAQIQAELAKFPEWGMAGDSIQRTYRLKDFVEAMAFVNQVAAAAEAAQHHPDILIRWNKVTLTLSTHDAGGITQKDFELASKCDQFSAGLIQETPGSKPTAASEGSPAAGAAGKTTPPQSY